MRKRIGFDHKNGRKDGKRGYSLYLVYSLLLILLLGGCQTAEEEPDNLVIVEHEEQQQRYTLAVVTEGDVVQTKQFRCSYQQVRREDISFSVGGKTVSEVYVSEGDQVKKGQLLAELGDSSTGDRIEELEYEIQRNQILLDQLPLNQDYEISTLWLQYLYQSNQTEQEMQTLEGRVEQIRKNYRHSQEEYEDAIYLANLELEELRQEMVGSKVYATMDGYVSWVQPNLKGALSVEEDPVIRLTDSSECLFSVNGIEGKELFAEGEPVSLTIAYGAYKGVYSLLPYQIDQWENQMLFALEDGTDMTIEVGTTGTISMVLDERDHVLMIPKRAVHTADGKAFVYCLGEDNMREVKWVETGLYGDDNVEITSGLTEGEMIIQ